MNEMLGDGPSLKVICVGFLGLGLIGLCLSSWKWWTSFPILIILCLWAFVLLDDFYAPDLHPVYSKYPEFLYSATTAISVGTLLPIIGILIYFVRRFCKTK